MPTIDKMTKEEWEGISNIYAAGWYNPDLHKDPIFPALMEMQPEIVRKLKQLKPDDAVEGL